MMRTLMVAGLSAAMLMALTGCGGGGGGDGAATASSSSSSSSSSTQPQLTATAATITASAATNDPTPTAALGISVVAASEPYFITSENTSNGIASLSSAVGTNALNLTIQFRPGILLGTGVFSDTITIKACRDQPCTQQVAGSPMSVSVTYTVTAAKPRITSLSPNRIDAAGVAFTLTVNGSVFNSNSVVLWDGSPKPTTLVSSTQLTAQISAADITTAGSVPVVVRNVPDGSANSAPTTLAVTPLGPLTASRLSPTSIVAGGSAFNLTIVGAGFSAASTVAWNGTSIPTTYLSGTALRALVTPSQIATIGSAAITVINQGSITAPLTLPIVAPSISAVSIQMNPAHTGAVKFQSVSLPSSKLWTRQVTGTASYALIVGGRVFVTSGDFGTNSQLVALDSATGAVLWGPIAFSGLSNAAYDAGTLFVTSGQISSQIITAIDPATGNTKWNATVSGGSRPAPPVAADGIVYTLNNGVVTAFAESNGDVLWTYNVSGTYGAVGVTADGVYTSAPCTTYDLHPLLGRVLWTRNTGCVGGGGDTPVVADGVLYSPISGQTVGTIYDAQSGAVLGNFGGPSQVALTTTMAFAPVYNSNPNTPGANPLQGISRSNNQVLWTFNGNNALVGSPVVVNDYVFMGSSDGSLYAVDATSGAQVWTQNVGAAMRSNTSGQVSIYTGMSAGEGLLVVPAGNTVSAYLLSSNP